MSSSLALHASRSGMQNRDDISGLDSGNHIVDENKVKGHSEKDVFDKSSLSLYPSFNLPGTSRPCSYPANAYHAIQDLERPTLAPYNLPAMTPSSFVTSPFLTKGVMGSSPTVSTAMSECLSPDMSSFNISLISDTSEDDDEFHLPPSLDDVLYPASEVPHRSSVAVSHRGSGLGLYDFSRKDNATPFDGLGVVSIGPSRWRTGENAIQSVEASNSEYDSLGRSQSSCGSNYDSDSERSPFATVDSAENISSTFLEEALLTFTEDPSHTHTLGVIPECRSWYELDESMESSRRGSPVLSEAPYTCETHDYNHSENQTQRQAYTSSYSETRMKRNFLSATISSELKRSDSGYAGKNLGSSYIQSRSSRARSATWPTGVMGSRANEFSRSPVAGSSRGNGSQRVWRI